MPTWIKVVQLSRKLWTTLAVTKFNSAATSQEDTAESYAIREPDDLAMRITENDILNWYSFSVLILTSLLSHN